MPTKKENPELIPQIGVKNVPADIAEKMQAIANLEGVTYNELYNLAFTKFIEVYEAKNGKVKIRQKGKGLENL